MSHEPGQPDTAGSSPTGDRAAYIDLRIDGRSADPVEWFV